MKMALCPAHMWVSWRLASVIVAGENRLAKFRNVIVASHAVGCRRKLVCFVRSSPRGPRSVNVYKTRLTEVTM